MFTVGQACDVGQKRRGKANQDRIGTVLPGWFWKGPFLLVVVDGMGGYNGGEKASRLVVQAMLDTFRSQSGRKEIRSVLEEGVQVAHQAVVQYSTRDEALASMGSTLVAVALEGNTLSLVNVGDSRAYLVRDHKLIQISEDHSIVADLIRAGELTEEEALHHPMRSRLNRSLSAKRKEVQPFFAERTLEDGDQILLCSDGLWSVLLPETLLAAAESDPPRVAVRNMVRFANARGGPDNISVILARFSVSAKTQMKGKD